MKNFRALQVVENLFNEDFQYRLLNTGLKIAPFFKKNFMIYQAEASFKFIYVLPIFDDIPFEYIKGVYFSLVSILKDMPVMLYVEDCSQQNISRYMLNKINYISSNGDHCIFTEKSLVNIYDVEEKMFKKNYTFNTQLLVQFYLSYPIKRYTTREISGILNISPSTISRCNSFLLENQLIFKNGTSTNASYFINSKKELFDKVKPFLIKPYSNKIDCFLNADENRIYGLNVFKSGETAFSSKTNLSNLNLFEFALSKTDFRIFKNSYKNWSIDLKKATIYSIYEFIYDPSLFGKDRVISDFDTYIIMSQKYQKTNDLRIKEALSILEKRIING